MKTITALRRLSDTFGQRTLVSVAGLDHYFGTGDSRTQILFKNTVDFHDSQLVVITGPSGSGKTTLLTLIGAIRRLQEGRLMVLGKDMSSLDDTQIIDVRRDIGFIFQMHNLFSSLTAMENVQMACHGSAAAVQKAAGDAAVLLKRLGLGHRMDYQPKALSGGQRQRVAVARALVGKPKLILADEPTAALDKVSSLEVVALLKEWALLHGSAVIMVTHDNRVLDAADRIVNMVDGAIVSDIFMQEAVLLCEYLRKIAIFLHLTVGELTFIAESMERRHFEAGDVLTRQGEHGEEFFLVREGIVDVFVGEGAEPALTLTSGHCFGERALLSGGPREATVVARDGGTLYALGKPAFLHSIDSSPSFKTQLQNLYFAK